jgi:hypothetical protein
MKHIYLRSAFLAALAIGLSVPASAGDLRLTMDGGRVTIIADNVPLRQVLQEWARVGQTKIVNADTVSGPAITLQLINTPEREALDILLRSASGYIAAPRPVMVAGAGMYDRITIMATSHAPAATAASAAPPPTFQRTPTPADDEDSPINMQQQLQFQQPQSPVVGQFPGMPAQQPGPQPFVNPNAPTTPMTSSRPGMLPAPAPNGVPNPYQPGPVRPGGGGGD